MAIVIEDTLRLLLEFNLLPLEKCVSEEDASDIQDTIGKLIVRLKNRGLPPNDPLRFHETGRKLSERELAMRLEAIIKMWPKSKR